MGRHTHQGDSIKVVDSVQIHGRHVLGTVVKKKAAKGALN